MANYVFSIATLFSGHESQMMAAEMAINGNNLPIETKLVLWSDIDPKVRAIHNLVYPEYKNCCNPDVTKIDWETVSDVDLLIYSSPCQSVSRSGKRKGIKKGSGTESALLWSVEKAIATKRPKCCIMENVAGMLDPDFQPDFIKWTRTLSSYGYVSYYKVLSSAKYGIPQNRERLFLVSFRIDDQSNIPSFNWPKPVALTLKPEDLLDDSVDDKYIIWTNSRLPHSLNSCRMLQRDMKLRSFTQPVFRPSICHLSLIAKCLQQSRLFAGMGLFLPLWPVIVKAVVL